MSRQMFTTLHNLTKAYEKNMLGFTCLKSVDNDTMLAVGLYLNAIAFEGYEGPGQGRLRC